MRAFPGHIEVASLFRFSEMSNRELAKAGKLKASIRATKKEYQEAMQSLEQISNKARRPSLVDVYNSIAFRFMSLGEGTTKESKTYFCRCLYTVKYAIIMTVLLLTTNVLFLSPSGWYNSASFNIRSLHLR